MALFVVRHQHSAERCLTQDPRLGATLLNHLGRPNARQYGVGWAAWTSTLPLRGLSSSLAAVAIHPLP